MKLALLVISGIFIVAVLVVTSDRLNFKSNGFKRIFLPGKTIVLGQRSLAAADLRSIAGVTGKWVYFTTASPNRFIRTNLDSFNPEQLEFNLDAAFVAGTGKNFSAWLSGSTLYVFSGQIPAVAVIDITSGKSSYTPLDLPGFIYGVPASSGTYFLRAFQPDRRDLSFVSVTIQPDTMIYSFLTPGDSIQKGALKSDGALRYNQTGLVAYVFYYQNKFMVFNKNSGRLQVFDTIEKMAGLPGQLPGTAPLTVHQTSCVFEGKLYICSNLRSDSETREAYLKNIPVDIYEIETGRYLGSFYLPLPGRSLVKSMFMDSEGKLSAYYQDKTFVRYSVPTAGSVL
ncbi:hypothetical protein [Ravibacter arvi]|uniref:hypothetical protein n=1 Tax=Ravibacter arvi TaxID=2051041 RepID=UPI0031EBE742